jgi:hypothetical protein
LGFALKHRTLRIVLTKRALHQQYSKKVKFIAT